MIYLCIRKIIEGTKLLKSDIFIYVACEVRLINLLLAAWVCDYYTYHNGSVVHCISSLHDAYFMHRTYA
jgi:hypothetical protein